MNTARVLVIDQPTNVETMIRDGFLFYPVEVTFSMSKQSAIKEMKKEKPDLVVSGMKFGDGTIIDLLIELRQQKMAVPPAIFFADASSHDVSQKELMQWGDVDIIQRPFQMGSLHKKMDQAVTAMQSSIVQARGEQFMNTGNKVEEFQQLVAEAKSLGIPVAQLIKIKQLSK